MQLEYRECNRYETLARESLIFFIVFSRYYSGITDWKKKSINQFAAIKKINKTVDFVL